MKDYRFTYEDYGPVKEADPALEALIAEEEAIQTHFERNRFMDQFTSEMTGVFALFCMMSEARWVTRRYRVTLELTEWDRSILLDLRNEHRHSRTLNSLLTAILNSLQ